MKKPLHFSIALALLVVQSASLYAQRITVTVAGTGFSGVAGDGGPAKMAMLNQPYDVCIDVAHNIYFTDQNNQRIRKVAASTGVISTIAGGGLSAADGIVATDASISAGNLCTDPSGNIYFVASATKVRRIDALTNMITTVAGGGSATGDGIPAISASLSDVDGICIDPAGNLFLVVGDQVRKINMGTGLLTTVAGTGVSGYSGDGGPATAAKLHAPKYITSDHSGNLYFGDQNAGSFGDYVRRIDAATGIITTVIGGGGTLFGCPGSSCMIGPLSGLCCDNDDNVIFNEWSCSCRKWDHTSGWVSAVGGNFYIESFRNDTSSDYAYMNFNYGICADEANNYYIADRNNNRIRKIMQLTSAPSFAFGDAQSTKLCSAGSNPIDSLLWITDMDVAEIETWTVVTPPASGTLSGFPATAISNDTRETTKPTGVSYTPGASFTGADFFVVRVSDGTYSDTITIFVQVLTELSVTGPAAMCVGSTASMTTTIPGGMWNATGPHASVSSSGLVTGLSYGTTNIVYTVNGGCGIVSDSHPLSVDTVADAGIISGYETVCEGSTILLTNTATGGVWSTSNPNATVSSSGAVYGVLGGSVSVLYTVTTGCGTSLASKLINVTPLPNAGVISGSNEVCAQSSITLTTTGNSGVWNSASANATVSPSGDVYGVSVGEAVIHYNVVNECGVAEATKTIAVIGCPPVNLPEVSNQVPVSIYPNPASNMLNINMGALTASSTNISIADMAGRVVLQNELSNNKVTQAVNLSSLSDGVYLVTISGDAVHYVSKVVISR